MAHHVETDISVKGFGFTSDEGGKRLHFPHAVSHDVAGRVGGVAYGGADVLFDGLEGRLDTLRWTAEAASVGRAWLRDDAGRVDVEVDRIEMSRGLMLTRADRGVEIVSPHVSFSEMKLTLQGPFGAARTEDAAAAEAVAVTSATGSKPTLAASTREPKPDLAASTREPKSSLTGSGSGPKPVPVPVPAEPPALRQDRLRFLDSLSGRMYLTVKVVLDLPVIGKRSLDQQLRVAIQEGSLDFRGLENSLDWLEGAFLDLKHDGDRLMLSWKVPIVGSSRELISWQLDTEASTLASFGRVPVRSLADFRTRRTSGEPDKKGKQTLRALSLDAIDVALSLVAPRSFEAFGGLIMFGGDDSPGMVDMKVTGAINDKRPGTIKGTIGSIDTTIKDVHLGPATLTADRLHFDSLDELEVVFDGFHPTSVTVKIHRVTATNLSLKVGGRG